MERGGRATETHVLYAGIRRVNAAVAWAALRRPGPGKLIYYGAMTPLDGPETCC